MTPSEAQTQGFEPARTTLILAFATVYLVWGSTYLAIRFAIDSFPPFFMAGTRFFVAGTVLYGWCRLRGAPRPELDHWKAASVSGFFMLLIGNGGLTWAEQLVPSGLAALIVATVPLWLTLLAWAAPDGTRPGFTDGVGIVLGLVGVGALVAPENALMGEGSIDSMGGAVLVGASIAWAYGSLHSKWSTGPDSHLFGVALLMVAGGAWLMLAAVATGELVAFSITSVSPLSVFSLIYLIVFGSIVAFSTYVWLLKAATPAQVGTYAFVNPVVAVALGWMFAGEPVTPRIVLAAGIIVVGVALIVWQQPNPEKDKVQAWENKRRAMGRSGVRSGD